MDDDEFVEKLKRGIENWNEQARFWKNLPPTKRSTEMVKTCRAKARQWADLIEFVRSSKARKPKT